MLAPVELEPEELDVTREPPEEDPPELVLDPPRGAAVPDLPLDEDEGVREPAGVCTRGGSGAEREGSGPLAVDPPPDEPEPDELEPPAGLGIA